MDWQAPCYQECPRLTAIGVIVKSSRCQSHWSKPSNNKHSQARKSTAKQEQAQSSKSKHNQAKPSNNMQQQARTSKSKQEQARTSKNKQEQATCRVRLVTTCIGAIISFVSN
ncbi:unnamed protein product [Absidia cylindrospora]